MMKDFVSFLGDFNYVAIPLSQLQMYKRDNGFFLPYDRDEKRGFWSSCFMRIATKQDFFTILPSAVPKCPHTYTKVPKIYADDTYFVCVNFQRSFRLEISGHGGRIVGMDTAQKHKSADYYTQSAILYSPGFVPVARHDHFEKENDLLYFHFQGEEEIRKTDVFVTANHKKPFFFRPE